MRGKAIIVGGGIAGPACALFLRKAGFDVEIYEAYAERAEIGGALGLAPNGMNVLGELGLAEKVIKAGTVFSAFAFLTEQGRPIGTARIGGPGEFGLPAVALSRAKLHEIVVEAAKDAGIRIAYGKRLVAMEETATGVTARFEDGSEATGDFLVGADGVNSRVRDIILPEGPKPAFTGLVGTGGFLPRSAVPLKHRESEATMGLYFGDGRFFGYGFGDRGEANGAFWWTALERAAPIGDAERAAITFNQVREWLLSEGAEWDGRVRKVVDATTRYIPPLNIFDVASLPRWSRGRVVLIGDAAHAVSPHSGQGASMALEDAIVLAKRLREKPHAITAAFRQFEAERRERVERVVAYGRRSGDTKKKRGPVAAWMQRLLMPLFIRLAGRGMRWVYSHRVRWEEEVEEVRRAA